MDKFTIFAALASIIPAGYFIWTQDMQAALITLIAIAILDGLTGVAKAGYLGTFKTKILWDKTLWKIAKLTLAITLGYFLDIGIGNGGVPSFSFLSGVFIYFCFFFASVEGLSILENLDDMDLPVPTGFIKYFRRNLDKCEPQEKIIK